MNGISKLARAWNQILVQEKSRLDISELEFSALSSWVVDCYVSQKNIYEDLLAKIEKADPDDLNQAGLLHEYVMEILFELNHIKEHIEASENGFTELIRVLGEKAEN